jgi:hypothetical protein
MYPTTIDILTIALTIVPLWSETVGYLAALVDERGVGTENRRDVGVARRDQLAFTLPVLRWSIGRMPRPGPPMAAIGLADSTRPIATGGKPLGTVGTPVGNAPNSSVSGNEKALVERREGAARIRFE